MPKEKSEINPFNLTPKQLLFLAALKSQLGSVSGAAKKTGLDRSNYYEWLKRDNFKAATEQQLEDSIDELESELEFRIKGQYHLKKDDKGNIEIDHLGQPIRVYINPPDSGLLRFKLLTKAKGRGYVYRNEITGSDNNPLFGGIELNIRKRQSEEGK